ncbi:hypothetical protein ACO1O0_002692 [Amphichorda felina]
MPVENTILATERLLPRTKSVGEKATALSLLDATTANFALTNAIWLFEPPNPETFNGTLTDHFRQSLRVALDAYPQWCGRLKSVTTVDGTVGDEAKHFPPHARRFGRVYVHYGISDEPGVEFITAKSSATLDTLYKVSRPADEPLWDREQSDLKEFVPSTAVVGSLDSNEPNEQGLRKPLMAVQVTELACGGVVLAAKSTHPLADISALVQFIKDWAKVSRATLSGDPEPTLRPVFDPGRLDSLAAGDINAEQPDEALIQQAEGLPLHRYDWWAPAPDAPSVNPPNVFQGNDLAPAGKSMPWSEWDVRAPVSSYIVHLSRDQVESIWNKTTKGGSYKISRHDVVLGHIWSCIMRARNFQEDYGPVHCDLVYGLRPVFQLGEDFMGTPMIMLNVEMPGADLTVVPAAAGKDEAVSLQKIAQRVRETISKVGQPANLAAHLHSVAYEKSPQRIWQAFLGRRHILVTTWARAGIYDIDFGLGSNIRYADGIVPNMDGCVLIKEAPPTTKISSASGSTVPSSWTDNGVDITIHIGKEDMERLLKDPLLLPRV